MNIHRVVAARISCAPAVQHQALILQDDMGLSNADVEDLTLGWNATMSAAQKYILGHEGYTWSLMWGEQNANAMPALLRKATSCQRAVRRRGRNARVRFPSACCSLIRHTTTMGQCISGILNAGSCRANQSVEANVSWLQEPFVGRKDS
eukprot:gene3189-biopygen11893